VIGCLFACKGILHNIISFLYIFMHLYRKMRCFDVLLEKILMGGRDYDYCKSDRK